MPTDSDPPRPPGTPEVPDEIDAIRDAVKSAAIPYMMPGAWEYGTRINLVNHIGALLSRLARAESDLAAAREQDFERAFHLSAERFARLSRLEERAWERLADDLENPSLQARAAALNEAVRVMLGEFEETKGGPTS